MREDVAREWVHALRSGAYKQSVGRLRSESNGCCCLGVLCDLKEGTKWELVEHSDADYYLADGAASVLPNSVMNWAEMKFDNGMYKISGTSVTSLVSANDRSRKSFKQIADIIENNWEQL